MATDKLKLKAAVEKLTKKFGDKGWGEAAKELARRDAKQPYRVVQFFPTDPAVALASQQRMPSAEDDALLAPRQAADLLGCDVTTIHRHAKLGLISYVPFGARGRRFRKSTLLKEVRGRAAQHAGKVRS